MLVAAAGAARGMGVVVPSEYENVVNREAERNGAVESYKRQVEEVKKMQKGFQGAWGGAGEKEEVDDVAVAEMARKALAAATATVTKYLCLQK